MSLQRAAGRATNLDLAVPPWLWLAVGLLIATLLTVDILVVNREAKIPTLRGSAIETLVWAGIGIAFGLAVLIFGGGDAGQQWFSGYLIELSLSVDNVFVWALILGFFAVPLEYQHRVLFWGVFGAIALRSVFVFAGVALINRFEWILFLFGAFLVFTAFRLVTNDAGADVDPGRNPFLRVVRRLIPSTSDYDGQRLVTRQSGKLLATPLFAVLVMVETTDVVFAVDSVPAVLAISRDQFIVLTSNAFAILGLRSLYFLLADMRTRFRYLQQGLAVILAFVGVKMISERWVHLPTWLSLLVILAVLAFSVLASGRHEAADVRHPS